MPTKMAETDLELSKEGVASVSSSSEGAEENKENGMMNGHGDHSGSEDDFETVVRRRHGHAKAYNSNSNHNQHYLHNQSYHNSQNHNFNYTKLEVRNGHHGRRGGGGDEQQLSQLPSSGRGRDRDRDRERDFRSTSRPFRRKPFKRDGSQNSMVSPPSPHKSEKGGEVSDDASSSSLSSHDPVPIKEVLLVPAPPPSVNPWHRNRTANAAPPPPPPVTTNAPKVESTKTSTKTAPVAPSSANRHSNKSSSTAWPTLSSNSQPQHNPTQNGRSPKRNGPNRDKQNGAGHMPPGSPKLDISKSSTDTVVAQSLNHDSNIEVIIAPAPPPAVNPWHVKKKTTLASFLVKDDDPPPSLITADNGAKGVQNAEGPEKKVMVNGEVERNKFKSNDSTHQNGVSSNDTRSNQNYPPRGRGRGYNGSRGGRTSAGRKMAANGYWTFSEAEILSEEFPHYTSDYTTIPPMYPLNEFVMPYSCEPYFPTPTPTYVPPQAELEQEVQLASGYVPVETAVLQGMVKKQIEYYFSTENLEKDFFLRRKMNSEGYLPVTCIATFPRVKVMTQDMSVVIQAIRSSQDLELTDDLSYLRTRHNPDKWPISSTTPLPVPPQNPDQIDKGNTNLPGQKENNIDQPNNDGNAHLPVQPQNPDQPDNSALSNNNGAGVVNLNPEVPEFVPRLVQTKPQLA